MNVLPVIMCVITGMALMGVIVWFTMPFAFTGSLDRKPPERLTFLYLSIDHEINPGFKWLIYADKGWSGLPAFPMQNRILFLLS
jgi:hypothetical protein